MPRQLDLFLKDVASAKAKGDAADAELIKKLKVLPAEKFVRVPREVLNALSNEQYADIVRAVAPFVKLKLPVPAPSPQPKRNADWSALPRPIVAIVAGLLLGIAILLTTIFAPQVPEWWSYLIPLSRETDATYWPRCERLTRWTDGCVYVVTHGLSWTDAARYLDLPESDLRRLNYHIQTDTIPAGAYLTVWRNRFELQRSR
jgi:hypothetical protein